MKESIIIGLDHRDSCLAAVRYGAWLRRIVQEAFSLELLGIHAMVETDLQTLADDDGIRKSKAKRRHEVLRLLTEGSVGDEFADVQVEHGPSVRDVLHRACSAHEPLALVIGRRAKAAGRHVPPRLGAAARRLVRHPPGPLIVVPPDYDPHRNGTGDVVALTDLTESSAPGFRFAARLAERCGRRVRPIHVVPEGYARRYVGGETTVDQAVLERTAGEADRWAADLSHAAESARVAAGPVVAGVIGCVETLDPLLLVVGTRELSLGERALLSSHSSELAARAPCPVAVIPSP